ncbi:MAG: hypothetical protein OES13_11870 [Acidimicrobiia bacterium]|nr:hypothetical protein [Acidimicrobiia bacterium]
MAIESSTIMTISDPSKLEGDLNDTVRPALEKMGALEVMAGVALTGPMTGMGLLSSRWESLGAWAAASAEMESRMAPGGGQAELAERYQIAQRIIAHSMHEAGDTTGSFVNASRYSFTGLPQGLENAAQLAIGAGAKGLRISQVLAGGDMTGHVIGAMFLDSLDGLPDILAGITSDSQFVTDVQAAGGKLESRTIFRAI